MTPTSPVHDDPAQQRFEMDVDGHVAYADYRLDGDVMTFTHTLVPEPLRGRGIASQLVEAALAEARSRRLEVVPQCPMVAGYMQKHPETQDLLGPGGKEAMEAA